jgi:hypothetical protein
MPLDPNNFGTVGGDDEPPLTLKTLARRNPDVEFYILGRNSGEDPATVGMPPNVINPWTAWRDIVRDRTKGADHATIIAVHDELTLDWFRSMDHLIVWTGQHGTSNTPIPVVGAGWEKVTNPQDSFVRYASYIVRGINAFRQEDPLTREEIWLCPDPRNYIKARDLKWPLRHPVLGQYDFTRKDKQERYTDTRTPAECGFEAEQLDPHVWRSAQRYVYSRLEICGITPEHVPTEMGPFEGRQHFGLFINEARAYVKHNRFDAMRDWVLPQQPAFIHGKWPAERQAELGVSIEPAPSEVYYDRLRSVAATFTTPSSGSGWATTKPWQAFGTGTVCFFHPQYDTQGHIIPTLAQVRKGEVIDDELASLAMWLRVEDPEQLSKRIAAVSTSRDTWEWLAGAQRRLYDAASEELRYAQLIEQRMGIQR